MKLAKALLGAVVAGIALAGSTATRAEPPVYVTVMANLGPAHGGAPQQVFYIFSVTNDLGGANRIYQFSVILGFAFDLVAPTGFDGDDFGTWTDDDYNSAIAPGETGGFYAFNYNDSIPSSIEWFASVEGGPNGEAAVSYGGVALPNVPESSTWAMMLLGFAGLGFAGYRAVRKGVSLAA